MKNRVTSENITKLNDGEIFVFGANLGGKHLGGAARQAMSWGAKYGNPAGLQGKTYAIPTKNAAITKALPINEIGKFVNKFIEFAKQNPDLTFLVSPIGCGLAGLNPNDVAPLFYDAINIENIHLPQMFWNVLTKK